MFADMILIPLDKMFYTGEEFMMSVWFSDYILYRFCCSKLD
jgi:hypothetical protein